MAKTWEVADHFSSVFNISSDDSQPSREMEYLLMAKTYEVVDQFNSCFPCHPSLFQPSVVEADQVKEEVALSTNLNKGGKEFQNLNGRNHHQDVGLKVRDI